MPAGVIGGCGRGVGLGSSGLRTKVSVWYLLGWRLDWGEIPHPPKGVSSPAGWGRALSLKESPVGTKISSSMSPTPGFGLERGFGVLRGLEMQ